MKKISLFATQDSQFRDWSIAESDLSTDAKNLFWTLYRIPSRIFPTNEDAKRYSGIKSTARLRRAFKELELRGVMEYVKGGVVLRDKVLDAPPGEVLPLKGPAKVKPEPKLQEEFRVWYMSWFMRTFGERYPWAWGKDNSAVIRLIQNYGLEGAKAKVEAAHNFRSSAGRDQAYYNKAARSLALLASVASQLIQSQIEQITDPAKWERHKASEVKL